MKSATPARQQKSILLNDEENDLVFQLLGPKCLALATTVVQLYVADGPESIHWVKYDAGVLCLIRDSNKRSYFFRIYCLSRCEMIWEQEIYRNLQYLAQRPFLHTFEAERHIVAFNFADEEEATFFKTILLEKLKCQINTQLDQKNKENRLNRAQSLKKNPDKSLLPPPDSILNQNKSNNGNLRKKSKKKGFSKEDIGQPVNFVHVSHVGFDGNAGFKMENIDDTMKQFLGKAGISENDVKDPETLEYIYDFIDKHGGYDALKQNLEQPTSVNAPPQLPRILECPPPYSTLPRSPTSKSSARTQQIMHPAPPPPPSESPPLNVTTIRADRNQLSKNTATFNKPIPPPLPSFDLVNHSSMIQSISASEISGGSSAPDCHSSLMQAIRGGTSLKRVETETKNSSDQGGRGQLLNQIREGVQLKCVNSASKPVNSATPINDLASALARALAERHNFIHTDSSDSSDTDTLDNEWDD